MPSSFIALLVLAIALICAAAIIGFMLFAIARAHRVSLNQTISDAELYAQGAYSAAKKSAPWQAARQLLRQFRHKKRQERLNIQLLKTLPQIKASIRSSLTLKAAIRSAASYNDEPLKSEFAQVAADVAYDCSEGALSRALMAMADRTGSPEVKTLAIGVGVQERRGGSLVPLIETVTDTIDAGMAAKRQRNTKIADLRYEKILFMAALPAMICMICAAQPDFAAFYTSTPLGWALIGACVVMELLVAAASAAITKIK